MIELGAETVPAHERVAREAAEACDAIILVGRTWPRQFVDTLAAAGFPAEAITYADSLADATTSSRGIHPRRRRGAVRERPARQLRVGPAVRTEARARAARDDEVVSAVAKRSVAVIFGGRTPEHEVSILTAHEAIAVLRAMERHESSSPSTSRRTGGG